MKVSRLDDTDLYLFHQGNSTKAYKFLGAHCTEEDGQQGVRFSLWAPGNDV